MSDWIDGRVRGRIPVAVSEAPYCIHSALRGSARWFHGLTRGMNYRVLLGNPRLRPGGWCELVAFLIQQILLCLVKVLALARGASEQEP